MRRGLAVFLLGFALRAVMILSHPVIFGGDTLIHLVNRRSLFLGYQMPGLQMLIAAVSEISTDPALVRYMMAAIGATAGLGFYLVIRDLLGEKWAFPAALLFVTNPFLLVLSTVPYQEILMLAGLLLAFHFFYTEKWLAASLCLGIACLTRYESWAACPVLVVAYILRNDRSVAGWLKAALLFGWAPAVWILTNGGITSPGHFVLERSISIWRLERYLHLGSTTAKFTPVPVLLLAIAGTLRLCKDRSLIGWRLLVQVAFIALFCGAIVFSAHGVAPDPERYVTWREAHLPIYFVLVLAAWGLAQWPRWLGAIVGVSVVFGLAETYWYLRFETSRPQVDLAYQLAQYLDTEVRGDERVLVLAKPIEPEIQDYLDKAHQTGGEEGLLRARLSLLEVDLSPPDYQRTLVHSRLGRDRLLSSPAECTQWIAVWSDYPDSARELDGAEPVRVLRAGPMSITIVRHQCRANEQ